MEQLGGLTLLPGTFGYGAEGCLSRDGHEPDMNRTWDVHGWSTLLTLG